MSVAKILITGATGFLGGAIVAKLVQSERSAEVLALIRAADDSEALRRLKDNLRLFDVPENRLDTLTAANVIVGDLGDTDWHQDARLRDVERIINSAAVASFGDNPRIWSVNVDDTFIFAEAMSRLPRLKRFVHIGTGMACGVQAESPVTEDYDVGSAAVHLVPYTHSKAAIETRIEAELPELPLIVARPSIVVGHTTLGCRPSSSIFWVFRMAKALGAFVCNHDDCVDVIPADWCADAMLFLAEKPQLRWKRYHVSAGPEHSCSFRDIDSALSHAMGLPATERYAKVDYQQLFDRRREFPALFGVSNPRIILKAIKLYGGFSSLNVIFSNTRLIQEGFHQPPPFTGYIERCVETSRHTTVGEQMAVDFK